MTGTPASAQRCASRSRSSSRSRHTSRASRASSTPVAARTASSVASGAGELGGQRVDDDDGVAAAGEPHGVGERLGRDERRQQDDEGPRRDAAAELGAQRPLLADGAPAGLGTAQPEQHPGELAVAADGRHLDDPGTAEHRQARPGRRSSR